MMPPDDRNDPGSGSGPPKYPGTFLLTFREAAAGLGWQVRRWTGHLVECVDAEGKEHVVGLENVYRRARQTAREEWPALIAGFLQTVSAAEQEENLPADLAAVAGQLLVRVGQPLQVGSDETRVWSQVLAGTNLVINLVIDYPDRMCYVTELLVAGSGRAGAAWLEQALDNLQARTPADCFQVFDEECGLRMCGAADSYDSSRALLLDRLLPETRGDGCFVALPGRDQLFVLPVCVAGLSHVHLLKMLAEKNFKSAPYPITDEVFWVRKDLWCLFRINIKGENVTIEPPEEFVEILNRLAPQEEISGAEEAPEE